MNKMTLVRLGEEQRVSICKEGRNFFVRFGETSDLADLDTKTLSCADPTCPPNVASWKYGKDAAKLLTELLRKAHPRKQLNTDLTINCSLIAEKCRLALVLVLSK